MPSNSVIDDLEAVARELFDTTIGARFGLIMFLEIEAFGVAISGSIKLSDRATDRAVCKRIVSWDDLRDNNMGVRMVLKHAIELVRDHLHAERKAQPTGEL